MSLLPDGLSDTLFEKTRCQQLLQGELLHIFTYSGYMQVGAPLFEFAEDLEFSDEHHSRANFRTTDPISNRTLAFRTDITPQMARIARVRLQNEPRPLRLCYAGEVVRMKGSLLRPDRQFNQLGCELIGDNSIHAEAELLALAINSLNAIGIEELHIDIALVNMSQLLARWFQFDDVQSAWLYDIFTKRMLDQVVRITQDKKQQQVLLALLKQSGDVIEMVNFFAKFSFPMEIQIYFDRLQKLWDLLKMQNLQAEFHIDFAETRGVAYHAGWAYAFYSKSSPRPLGRGGVYQLPISGESAVGFSFYMDSLLILLDAPEIPKKILLAAGTHHDQAIALRHAGYIAFTTFQDLPNAKAFCVEAKRLGCDFYYFAEEIIRVDG